MALPVVRFPDMLLARTTRVVISIKLSVYMKWMIPSEWNVFCKERGKSAVTGCIVTFFSVMYSSVVKKLHNKSSITKIIGLFCFENYDEARI